MSFKNALIALSAAAVALSLAGGVSAQQAPGGQQQPTTQQPPATPPQTAPPPPKPANTFSPQSRTFGADNGANFRP